MGSRGDMQAEVKRRKEEERIGEWDFIRNLTTPHRVVGN